MDNHRHRPRHRRGPSPCRSRRHPRHPYGGAECLSDPVRSATVEPARAGARWQIQRDLGAPRLVIEALAVRERQRRGGVGGALMRAIEAWGRECGAAVARADTNLRSPLSLPFYERGMGYARRGVVLRKGLHAS